MLWGIPSFIVGVFAAWMLIASLQDYVAASRKNHPQANAILFAAALFTIAAAIAFK